MKGTNVSDGQTRHHSKIVVDRNRKTEQDKYLKAFAFIVSFQAIE